MCLLQLRSHRVVLCLLAPSQTVNNGPCHGLVMCSSLLRSLLVVSLFKMVLGHNAEVPASVPGPKKAVMCLTQKMRGSDKLPSGVSHSAAGRVQC